VPRHRQQDDAFGRDKHALAENLHKQAKRMLRAKPNKRTAGEGVRRLAVHSLKWHEPPLAPYAIGTDTISLPTDFQQVPRLMSRIYLFHSA